VQTRGPGTFQIRCAELCGLFHGYMFKTGHVVPMAQFRSWARSQDVLYASIRKYVPPYATTYVCPALGTSESCSPQPTLRGG
jgi:cytochrome c oxidase subunit II